MSHVHIVDMKMRLIQTGQISMIETPMKLSVMNVRWHSDQLFTPLLNLIETDSSLTARTDLIMTGLEWLSCEIIQLEYVDLVKNMNLRDQQNHIQFQKLNNIILKNNFSTICEYISDMIKIKNVPKKPVDPSDQSKWKTTCEDCWKKAPFYKNWYGWMKYICSCWWSLEV